MKRNSEEKLHVAIDIYVKSTKQTGCAGERLATPECGLSLS
jgi:hypothetical protein